MCRIGIAYHLNEENSNWIAPQTRYSHIPAWSVVHGVHHVTSRCLTTWTNFYKCLWLVKEIKSLQDCDPLKQYAIR